MNLFALVLAVFCLVGLLFVFQAVRGLAEWSHNNSQPVLSVPARVVSKRTDVSGRVHYHGNAGGRVSTSYFVTFELKSGDRLEFRLRGEDYGLIAEGDQGTLTYQGTRYQGFQRDFY